MNAILANDLLTELNKFNRGILGLTIEYGIVAIRTKSQKCVQGVTVDLLRSRAFKSVNAIVSGDKSCYLIHAIPA